MGRMKIRFARQWAAALLLAAASVKGHAQAKIQRAQVSPTTMLDLLKASDRVPQAELLNSDQLGLWKIALSLNPQTKKQLIQKIRSYQKQRIELEKTSLARVESESSSLRIKREQIQRSRIASTEQTDEQLGKNLFESLIAEANAKSAADQNIREFDDDHSLYVEFMQDHNDTQIAAIEFAGQQIWRATHLAQK